MKALPTTTNEYGLLMEDPLIPYSEEELDLLMNRIVGSIEQIIVERCDSVDNQQVGRLTEGLAHRIAERILEVHAKGSTTY